MAIMSDFGSVHSGRDILFEAGSSEDSEFHI